LDIFRVTGGKRLKGEVRMKSAKNAVLPMLAASVMTSGETILNDCPELDDIKNMCRILNDIGCETETENGKIRIRSERAFSDTLESELTGKLRSSVFMMGPMLSRFGKARVAYPGGCDIGQRPIDLHLKGLRALGVRIRERNGYIILDGSYMKPGEILLDFPSVGATENLIMASIGLKGKSIILNAAREPEVRDLISLLNKMGARITGAGTGRIEIEGTDSLAGCAYTPIPDRIAAGTILCAAAITGGEVGIENTVKADMEPIVGKLREMGAEITETENRISISVTGRLKSVNIQTLPHPGFPTDMQSQMTALLSLADGTGAVVENIFENRFTHVPELKKMGADITVYQNYAYIRGGELHGARVKSKNLRAGAALVIAALAAEGESRIEDVFYIDRGYEKLEETMVSLGADMERTKETRENHGKRKEEQ